MLCVFFFNFLFCIGVLISNVVVVSGESEGTQPYIYMDIHVSILPQTPLPSKLAHNIEQNSTCYTIGLCWLSVLNIAVCT